MKRTSAVRHSWTSLLIISTILLAEINAAITHSKRSRHHRDSVTSSPSTTHVTPLLDTNPCLVHYCPKGHECTVDDSNEATCICQRFCGERRKLVCGSDGHIYPNHCELHRSACLANTPITIERGVHCIKHGKGWAPGVEPPLQHYVTTTPPAIIKTTELSSTTQKSLQKKADNITTVKTTDSTVKTSTSTDINEDIDLDYDRIDNDSENEIDIDSKDDLYYEKQDCSMQEYEIMKDNLLLYNHARLMSQDNHSKDYLVSIMFSHYDQNNNGNLETEELNEIAGVEHLEALSNGCSLAHMIQFDDTDHDGRLTINEFYLAFSKLYSVSVVSLDKALETNHLSARVGDNVEIKCDVTGSPVPPIVWRRNGLDLATLNEEEVRVFSDGSLYLTRIQLQHAGNYTCHAQRNKDVVQTHVLTVHTIPEVRVTPRIQSKRPGEEAVMYCHVIGEPFPKVEWLKNDEKLHLEVPHKFQIVGNGTALKIHNIAFADTGAYMCQAGNIGGLTRDISSLVVQEQPSATILSTAAPNEERRFFAFHDWGISVYEPSACRLYHQIQSTDIIPGTQEYVCGDKGVACNWGRAINVANRYVYASQPDRDRVLVISKIQMVVVDVVVTDKFPVDLHYVPHLDQVWVLNWRADNNTGIKTIQVIRDAGQKRKHHTVHPEPIDGQFDLVRGLYIPAANQELSHFNFKYGYVTHTNQRGLYKLDLSNLRYTKSVDLTPYNCVPAHVQFSALYGYVIMECLEPITNRQSGQLLLDYLTDTVIGIKQTLPGQPFISPDARRLVTLDRTNNGATLIVQEVTANGLIFSFDVKTTLNISDVTFYPSQTTHSYDLYASAKDKEDILFLNLLSGKVEMITGVGKATPSELAKWDNPNRPITASGQFGQYMVTPASAALFVINGQTRTVNCEIGGLTHPNAVVWTTLQIH